MIRETLSANISLYGPYFEVLRESLDVDMVLSLIGHLKHFEKNGSRSQPTFVVEGEDRNKLIGNVFIHDLSGLNLWALHYRDPTTPACTDGDGLYCISTSGKTPSVVDHARRNNARTSCITANTNWDNELLKYVNEEKIFVPDKTVVIPQDTSEYIGSLNNLQEAAILATNRVIALGYAFNKKVSSEPRTNAKLREHIDAILLGDVNSTKECMRAVENQRKTAEFLIKDIADKQLLLIIGSDEKTDRIAEAAAMRCTHMGYGNPYRQAHPLTTATLHTMESKLKKTGNVKENVRAIIISENPDTIYEGIAGFLEKRGIPGYVLTSRVPKNTESDSIGYIIVPNSYKKTSWAGSFYISAFPQKSLCVLDSMAGAIGEINGVHPAMRHKK